MYKGYTDTNTSLCWLVHTLKTNWYKDKTHTTSSIYFVGLENPELEIKI